MIHIFRTSSFFRRLTGLATLGIGAAFIAGCTAVADTEAQSEDCERVYRIGFSHPFGEAAFVKAVKASLEEQAEAHGCVELHVDGTQGNDLEGQRSAIETWLMQKNVDAIVLQPVDNASLQQLRDQAKAEDIDWITWAAKTEDADGFVGFDFEQAGELAGKAALKWAETEGITGDDVTAAVLTWKPFPAGHPRYEVPIEILEEAGFDVVSTQDCADQTCGLQIIEDALRSNPDLRIVIGNNDDGALGAAKAFEDAGIDPDEVFIAGQDGALEALERVKSDGHFKASVAISVEETAAGVLSSAINAIDGTGSTEAVAPNILGTLDEPEVLDELIDAYGSQG